MLHRLRPAESSDFEWLWSLRRAWQQPSPDAPSASDPTARSAFARAFVHDDPAVVEVDGQPVGALYVRWEDDPVEVAAVELAGPWQGRGLGTRLVHDVLLQARQLDRAVEVSMPAGNPAVALFRRLGFKPMGMDEDEGEATDDSATDEPAATPTRLRWEASLRTDVTLQAAMAPWADPRRRRAWVHRLFDPPPDEHVAFARFVAGRHGLPSPPATLLWGCGLGTMLRPLGALRWPVAAHERDPELRAVARRVAAGAGPTVQVHEGAPASTRTHDLVLVPDGALWAVLDHDARVDVLRSLHAAVRPEGALVLDGPNVPWILDRSPEAPARSELYHRATVSKLPARHLDVHDGVLELRDTYVVELGGQEQAEWIERRPLAVMGLPLLRLALREAGWGAIETFQDLRATGPARVTGRRIVLTARP